MITIKDPDSSRIYDLLNENFEDDFPSEDEDLENLVEDFGDFSILDLGHIELLDPLDKMALGFVKYEDFYTASIEIFAKDSKAFRGRSDDLKRNINEGRHHFIPSSKDMRGYIIRSLNGKQTPVATVFPGSKDLSRIISYGMGGAKPMMFDTRLSFKREISQLNSYANSFLKTIYNKSVYHKVLNSELPQIDLKYPAI